LKILQIHTKYQNFGGEDTTVLQEKELLSASYEVETLFFQNEKGIIGFFQFLCSIWNISASNNLAKKIKEINPDVIHIHNWHFAAGPIIVRTCNRYRIPVVMTIQNFRLLCPSALLLHKNALFTDSVNKSFPWLAVKKKVYRNSFLQTFWLAFVVWFHKKIGTWNKVDKYVCLTPFAVDLYKNSSLGVDANKFTIKPNFTYLPKGFDDIKREDYFLFIGRLSEEKGIKLLINAFENSSLKLKIAGTGPLEDFVKECSNKCKNIEYIGNLDKHCVLNQLKNCNALVFPSIWYEGMPLTIIESFACSTPIISSNLGAMSSMIVHGENGFHFEPGNVNDLKAVVNRFNSLSEIEKEKMRNNAFENYQSNYSPELQLGYFEAIYNKVISK